MIRLTRMTAATSCLVLLWTGGCSGGGDAERAEALPYDTEYPGIGYTANRPAGRLGSFASGVADGSIRLDYSREGGYLDTVLDELGIDARSQALVFSQTSLQTRFINSATPRAIYFSDELYVAWVPDAPTLELSGFDPDLGPVFYTLLQDRQADAVVDRKFSACLRCHDTYSLSGGGVPRFLLGSGYTNTDGELVSHEAWILTTQATPFSSRWGGWYVTGQHGDQVHLGNIVVERPEDLQDLEALRHGNIDELTGLLDTLRYLTPYSDIVALLVLEHQVEVQNLISRVRYEAERERDADVDSGAALEPWVDELVAAMLMLDEAELTAPVRGSSGFAEYFESLGPFDSQGRSLRDLDLQTRLFRYPLSYQIYSAAFQALPEAIRGAIYRHLRDALAGVTSDDRLQALSAADREAISAILRDTLPDVFRFQP